MASVSLFGGGFFFSPFNHAVVGRAVVIPDVAIDVMGPWVEIIPAGNLTGRWMQLDLRKLPLGVDATWLVQLGQGTAGSETVWQPLVQVPFLSGFAFKSAAGLHSFFRTYNFPVTIAPNTRMAARASNNLGGANSLDVTVSYWG